MAWSMKCSSVAPTRPSSLPDDDASHWPNGQVMRKVPLNNGFLRSSAALATRSRYAILKSIQRHGAPYQRVSNEQ